MLCPTAAVYCGEHLVHPHSLAPHSQVLTPPQTQVISLPHHTQYQLTQPQEHHINRVPAPRYRPQELTGIVDSLIYNSFIPYSYIYTLINTSVFDRSISGTLTTE